MIKLTSEERCRYVCFNFRYAVEQKHWPFHGKVGTTEFMRQALHSSMADHHLKFILKKTQLINFIFDNIKINEEKSGKG